MHTPILDINCNSRQQKAQLYSSTNLINSSYKNQMSEKQKQNFRNRMGVGVRTQQSNEALSSQVNLRKGNEQLSRDVSHHEASISRAEMLQNTQPVNTS